MGTNQDYKNRSLAVHRGNWAPALVATIVYMAVAAICTSGSSIPPTLATPAILAAMALSSMSLSLLILLPVEVGFMNTFKVQLESGDDALTGNMFKIAFSGHYWHNVWAMLLMSLKTFLWTLLFIIPGIVKSFAYAMTPYIIAEDPEMRAIDAIHLSQDMMRGHKFDYFYLALSFIGWIILSFFTLGIGLLWVVPYMQTAMAAFYLDVKAEYEGKAAAE